MSCNDCIILTLNTMEACKSRIKPFALNSHQTSSNAFFGAEKSGIHGLDSALALDTWRRLLGFVPTKSSW